MRTEFIFEGAPFAQCHASTIAETPDGLVAAWFGGTREGASDVAIWTSRCDDDGWRQPDCVAVGTEGRRRYPCWNPVLFQPSSGPLHLYYKVGPSPSRWWGMQMASADHGRSWSAPIRLGHGILGPIKNKPVELASGHWLSPSSCERSGWKIHVERTTDHGSTWHREHALNDGRSFAAIQPCVLRHREGRLQLLSRTRQGTIASCWSDDGHHWSPLAPTTLPNPDSGIDAVTTADGTHVLIYNHAQSARSPLNLAASDDGIHWSALWVLEADPGEYSYPAIIQGTDGRLHLTWTWNRRRIRYASLRMEELAPVAIDSGHWPDPPGAST
ncbi:MAG: sialidase family protein [Rhodospirillales bacterium]